MIRQADKHKDELLRERSEHAIAIMQARTELLREFEAERERRREVERANDATVRVIGRLIEEIAESK